VPTITNSPLIQTRQGVFPSDLQTLHFNLSDMCNLTSKIRENMVFQQLSRLRNLPSLEIGSYSSVWTLETNTFQAQGFLQICTLVEKVMSNTLSFVSVV
jgi:hypothetical protein